MRLVLCSLAIALLGLVALLGCGGATGAEGTGTLRVHMVDAPDTDVTSVLVTIDRIEAHLDGEWTSVNSTPQTIELLDLISQPMVVADGGLPVGSINQVRLFVSEATVTDSEGTHDVNIPSNLQTGIKLNINAAVQPGTVTAILLDFNVHKSLHQTGNGQWMLQPVIPAVLMNLAGTVSGTVTLNDVAVEGAVVTAVYSEGSAYPLGTEVNTSVTAAAGTFKVWALMPGKYTINVAYTDSTPANFSASMTDVVVTANNDTALGTIVLAPAP